MGCFCLGCLCLRLVLSRFYVYVLVSVQCRFYVVVLLLWFVAMCFFAYVYCVRSDSFLFVMFNVSGLFCVVSLFCLLCLIFDVSGLFCIVSAFLIIGYVLFVSVVLCFCVCLVSASVLL